MIGSLANNRGMSRIAAIITFFAVIVGAAGIGALMGYYFPSKFLGGGGIKEVFTPPFGGKRTVRILMLGEDDSGTRSKIRGLSDTIILLSIDLDTNHVAALSIPRDTKIEMPGYDTCKINAVHRLGGPALAAMAVEQLVGIKPDYYVKTNLQGFRKTVDILGGVEIDVEKNMHYTDNWGGLHINLKKGRQLLDGEKAMEYVRFRHDKLGDITRMERQQRFLKALAQRSLAPSKLPVLPRVIQSAMKNVETDMTVKDAIYLAQFLSKIDMNGVKTGVLPTAPTRIGRASYQIADSEKAAKVVQELFFPPAPGLPKLEVLNGSGISGAAQRVAEALKNQGYEIASVGNAGAYNYSESQIINHKGDIDSVDRIANILTPAVVKQEKDTSSSADVTIIVGRSCALAAPGS